MENQRYNFTIRHGIPKNNHFGIIQPCYEHGGLDCSCRAMGVGFTHKLMNPVTNEEINATLINRRHCYTDSDLFESFSYIIYGIAGEELLGILSARYEGMVREIVEIWTFKRD